MSNETNHKNDMFLQKNGRKASFTNVTMVTKMLHGYMSATVPDRPMVTIIGYNNGFTYNRCVCVYACVCVHVCVNFVKKAFSQFQSQNSYFLYISNV